MHVFHRRVTRLLAMVCLLALGGCADPQPGEQPRERASVEISDHAVRDGEGTVLLDMEAIPGNIQVTGDTWFGASGRFVGGALSPDGTWLAVSTMGAAHGAGWLLATGENHPYPAAFQYGGTVEPGPWSEDGRYATFLRESPGPGRMLEVVDREALADTVEENATPVRLPEHADTVPPETRYQAIAWRGGKLLFSVDGSRYHYDPDTAGVTPAGN
ncbi:MAG: hypothetical protein JJU06_05235 [Ectothiorhodospiraceae bacterium]|nr:hypothetical protein [Ectothiorhodospiraceae bacterium]MCH8503275.1 hypothetical protein [Ectothiorhodospiraceae bacterium]